MIKLPGEPRFIAEPVTMEEAQTWVGKYVKAYGRLPSEDLARSCNKEFSTFDVWIEATTILKLRPKFLRTVGASEGKMSYLKGLMSQLEKLMAAGGSMRFAESRPISSIQTPNKRNGARQVDRKPRTAAQDHSGVEEAG